MGRENQLRRLMWLALLLSLAFAGLGYRLLDLQVLRHEELSAQAQRNTHKKLLLEARRGDILDIKGNLLGTSILTKRVCANSLFLNGYEAEMARILSPLLGIPESVLGERLQQARLRKNAEGQTVTNQYVVLKENVPPKTWETITNTLARSFVVDDEKLTKKQAAAVLALLRQKAIFGEDQQQRVYPNGRLAAHVVGFVEMKNEELDKRSIQDMSGKDGIERSFNSKLAGVPGWRVTEADVGMRELVRSREQDVQPKDGLNVVLTLDSVVQHIVEEALADAAQKLTPISISGLVMRPRTGEVLAMATLPDFDPNDLRHGTLAGMRNRIITDINEPGSTFKIVVVSGALNEGVVKLTDRYDCENGRFVYAKTLLHDDHPHAELNVEGIITKSSNIGAAKIGIKMGETRLYDYIKNFGFGEATGIPLPGEASASTYVTSPKSWRKVTLAQIPMGHGICATRLQMTMAMCAIANHGVLMRPMLVDRLEDADHTVVAKFSPQKIRRVISEATAADMVKALKTVVSPEGTAPKATLEHYVVAGKTGTAKKVENGHYVSKYFSSFIGFFPADDPQLCISVTVDEPNVKAAYYGGTAAAPVFREIAERAANYLNIRPDDTGATPAQDNVSTPGEGRPPKLAARTQ